VAVVILITNGGRVQASYGGGEYIEVSFGTSESSTDVIKDFAGLCLNLPLLICAQQEELLAKINRMLSSAQSSWGADTSTSPGGNGVLNRLRWSHDPIRRGAFDQLRCRGNAPRPITPRRKCSRADCQECVRNSGHGTPLFRTSE
jgi:hypothetical protein